MTTTPPELRDNIDRNPDVLCPVQIHVHDPTIRERRRHPEENRFEKRRPRAVEDRSKKWIDLDENVLDGYILIDDKNLGSLVPEIEGEELSYPEDATEYNDDDDNDNDNDDDCDKDIGSHGKREWIYKRLKRRDSRRQRPDFDFGATYPLANSHGNAYQDTSSHSKYTELYSGYQSARNDLDMTRDLEVTSIYAVANSHSKNGDLATDMRNRDCTENMESDNLAWDIRRTDMNYEIANSHSNYRVFYDSQMQHQASLMPPWSSEIWSENHREECQVMTKDPKEDAIRKQNNEGCETNNASQSEKNEQDSETSCDIEQCLVQIEESLLNIEQNLLHVQDLDIPELRNLLYKSPSIERSLYEVQDLLYADGIVPAIAKNKSMSLDSEEEEEEEEDEEEEVEKEEVWVGQNITIKDNDDEDVNASAPLLNDSNEESSDTINEHNPSRSIDDHYVDWNDGSNVSREEAKDFQICQEKTMNFVPNSLGKTLPRRIVLDEVKENIRLCSSEPEESTIPIDYNLNSACVEKKSLFRDKWHSRTNSLDENSIFQNTELGGKQENKKFSLQDIFLEATGSRRLTINAKARSEGTLQTDREKRRDRRGSHEKKLLQAVEATAEDFRKKLESFASQRRSILDGQKRTTPKSVKEVSDNTVSRSREKRTTTSASKTQDKDNNVGKNTGCDKRKRKKTSGKNQSVSENALVPSKLISLSLSLLLAALLQAVRCLTDLVEDAFRSVSYDKGLLQ